MNARFSLRARNERPAEKIVAQRSTTIVAQHARAIIAEHARTHDCCTQRTRDRRTTRSRHWLSHNAHSRWSHNAHSQWSHNVHCRTARTPHCAVIVAPRAKFFRTAGIERPDGKIVWPGRFCAGLSWDSHKTLTGAPSDPQRGPTGFLSAVTGSHTLTHLRTYAFTRLCICALAHLRICAFAHPNTTVPARASPMPARPCTYSHHKKLSKHL